MTGIYGTYMEKIDMHTKFSSRNLKETDDGRGVRTDKSMILHGYE
jgi:hypothetical protein